MGRREGRSRLLLGALVTVLAACAHPSAAPAATYCVSDPACPVGGVPAGSLQAAFNAADGNGQADRVQLGAGTFNAGNSTFTYESTEALDLVGKGGDKTVLTRNAGNGVTVLTLNQATGSDTASVSDLGVLIPGGATPNNGLNFRGSATRVRISAAPGVTFATALNPFFGASFHSGAIDVPGIGVMLQGGNILVEDSSISADIGISTPFTTNATVRRSRITAESIGLHAGGGTLTVSDVLVRPSSPQGLFTGLKSEGGVIGQTTYHGHLTADNVTIAGDGSAGDTGAESTTTNGGTSALTLRNSTVTGFETALRRQQNGGGLASFTILHSNYLGPTPGVVPGATNKSVDPHFVGGGNFHLHFDSPLIDAGDPAGNPQPLDLDGGKRPVDGNGDGTTVQDLGALEYQRRPPVAAATSSGPAPAGHAVSFNGSKSSDPDPGDSLAYSWSFDDGGSAFGPLALHAFATGAPHSATLRVTDPTGLKATATVSLPGTATAAPVDDNERPVLSEVSVASPFAVAGRTRVSSRQRIQRGTAFRFRLSEAATVRIAIERAGHGRKRGKRCLKPTRRLRDARRCRRYVAVGTLTRRDLKAGSRRIAFSGRIGRRALLPWRYRARLTATDLSGNRSRTRKLRFRVVRARR